MSLEFHLRLAGILQIALAGLHLFFPARFRWKEELSRLSLLNRQIFLVHTFFICVVLVLMGALSLAAAPELLRPGSLPRMLLAGLAVFWTLRLAAQWLAYDARLWRGNRFNTWVHWLFTALWSYLAGAYAGALFLAR